MMESHRTLTIALSILLSTTAFASAQSSVIPNNTPSFVATAKSLGPANSAEVIDVSIWLNLRNRSEMNSLVANLYDRNSASYRQWLKLADVVAKFAPTAKQAAAVGEFLTAHNLSVVKVDPDNFVVRAQGTIANVEKAFQVQIGTFEVNGQVYRANTADPSVEGPAAALIQAVGGLDNLVYTHPFTQRVALNQSSAGASAVRPSSSATFIGDDCFPGPTTQTYNTNGTFPIATYKGNGYNSTTTGCGYTPPQIQAAYNLTGLYGEGFDGTGQTIVIIDWCGSPTIKGDANAFAAKFGLPPLTASNFQILNSGTVPTCAAPDPEINIDVEWAHAIAPGANIDLVVPPSASFQDVDNGELYAIENNLGNVISGSYGSEELYTPTSVLDVESAINEIAALMGMSANFASGDYGDYTYDAGFPASVSAPADSPYATAVGGVSLALNTNNTIAWQGGWGTNETLLNGEGTIYDPPFNFGFAFGSGGGPSAVFSKPSFQSSIRGPYRQQPDIAWLADPFTGGVIAISEPFVSPALEWTVYGGTSLATPMFSALWAIANQEAGAPLGQAAQYLYSMPAGTITDVVPVASTTNVTASIRESSIVTDHYTAAEVAAPLETTTKFLSALWNYPDTEDTVYVITFGTDSGLKTAPGWDDVTGLGTPNGQAFADYFNPSN
jgi:subtilase family serine protease